MSVLLTIHVFPSGPVSFVRLRCCLVAGLVGVEPSTRPPCVGTPVGAWASTSCAGPGRSPTSSHTLLVAQRVLRLICLKCHRRTPLPGLPCSSSQDPPRGPVTLDRRIVEVTSDICSLRAVGGSSATLRYQSSPVQVRALCRHAPAGMVRAQRAHLPFQSN